MEQLINAKSMTRTQLCELTLGKFYVYIVSSALGTYVGSGTGVRALFYSNIESERCKGRPARLCDTYTILIKIYDTRKEANEAERAFRKQHNGVYGGKKPFEGRKVATKAVIVSLDGEKHSFKSIKDAAEFLKMKADTLRKVITHNRKMRIENCSVNFIDAETKHKANIG